MRKLIFAAIVAISLSACASQPHYEYSYDDRYSSPRGDSYSGDYYYSNVDYWPRYYSVLWPVYSGWYDPWQRHSYYNPHYYGNNFYSFSWYSGHHYRDRYYFGHDPFYRNTGRYSNYGYSGYYHYSWYNWHSPGYTGSDYYRRYYNPSARDEALRIAANMPAHRPYYQQEFSQYEQRDLRGEANLPRGFSDRAYGNDRGGLSGFPNQTMDQSQPQSNTIGFGMPRRDANVSGQYSDSPSDHSPRGQSTRDRGNGDATQRSPRGESSSSRFDSRYEAMPREESRQDHASEYRANRRDSGWVTAMPGEVSIASDRGERFESRREFERNSGDDRLSDQQSYRRAIDSRSMPAQASDTWRTSGSTREFSRSQNSASNFESRDDSRGLGGEVGLSQRTISASPSQRGDVSRQYDYSSDRSIRNEPSRFESVRNQSMPEARSESRVNHYSPPSRNESSGHNDRAQNVNRSESAGAARSYREPREFER